MSKNWKTAACDETLATRVAAESNLPPPLASLLVSRGFRDAEAIDHFLQPRLSDLSDPFALPGMDQAVDRIWSAIGAGERIVVFGDYDADGVSSTALMVRVLSRLGAQVQPFLPHRLDDGYGLSADTLKRCADELHPQLLITVDCGTGSIEAVKAASASGLDVVVTDHHEPAGHVAPALAVVNPKLGSEACAKNLAGVGVAFKVCHALIKRGRDRGQAAAAALDLKEYFDLVGIGTIADIVPLQDENRILARYGLDRLNKTRSEGLKSLIAVSGIKNGVDAYHVGFLLGPRLNAAGRLGDARAALELLLTDAAARALELARQLDASNRERQEVEAQIVEEATQEIDGFFKPKEHFGLVLARAGWHAGVIGIVASRISAKYRRPAVVISLDEAGMGRGSCRSIEGFSLVERLEDCSDLLVRFGGHAMAAGLDIEAGRVEAFRQRFDEVAAKALSGTDLRAVQNVDAWMDLAAVDEAFFQSIERMRPFGFGNTTPVWAARGVRVVGAPRRVGDGKHLKLVLASGGRQIDAIGFGLGDREVPEGPLDVAFQLQKNTYQGRESLQLNVQDFRQAE